MSSSRRMTKTLKISLTAINAALYAMGAYLTAYIQSPWGMGQFRPAIVIPMVFATIFSPSIGALGGALGTLIADSIKHSQIYIPSLIAAVPGHLVAMFIYGWVIRKFTWPRFVVACLTSLLSGNLVTALLYVWFVMGQPYPQLVAGLTVWWYVTMLPFAVLLTPAIVKGVSGSLRGLIREDIQQTSFSELKKPTALALSGSGIFLLSIGTLFLLNPNTLANLFAFGKFLPIKETLAQVIIWMSIATGALILFTGLVIIAWPTQGIKIGASD